MKFTNFVDSLFYPYKIEKWDSNNFVWVPYASFITECSCIAAFHELYKDKSVNGIFRYIRVYEFGEVKK